MCFRTRRHGRFDVLGVDSRLHWFLLLLLIYMVSAGLTLKCVRFDVAS